MRVAGEHVQENPRTWIVECRCGMWMVILPAWKSEYVRLCSFDTYLWIVFKKNDVCKYFSVIILNHLHFALYWLDVHEQKSSNIVLHGIQFVTANEFFCYPHE